MDLSVFGLPLHPLVVHAVVVLLPLGALGLIGCVLVPRLRKQFGLLAVLTITVGAASVVLAKVSGAALAQETGLPVAHERWGNLTVVAAGILLLAAWIWWILGRRRLTAGSEVKAGVPERIAGGLAILAALLAIVFVVLTGHSGATAVWSGRISEGATVAAPAAPATSSAAADRATSGTAASPDTSSAAPDPGASATPVAPTTAPDATAQAGAGTPGERNYTLDEVRQHDTEQSCWAAIDGQVYDLTAWIPQHPGGAQRIVSICGTDATVAFANQHGDAPRPNEQLARFRVGALK